MSAVASSADQAVSNMNGRSNTVCRYHVRGLCRFGDLCRFSHDLSQSESEKIADVKAASGAVKPVKITDIKTWGSQMRPDAPEFVPQGRQESDDDVASGSSVVQVGVSWAAVVGGPSFDMSRIDPGEFEKICPYEAPCPYGPEKCPYRLHLELCEMCDQYCLHPTDLAQRRKHNRECLQQHEQAMELSFAIARSKDKTCGICFDTIMEKAGREKRFGILPNCNHIFCLECIRTWRQAKQFEHKITRACPECRVCSDFVCPSAYWVETKEEKDKLLNDYRAALGAKDCKYYKKGEGKCPFGNKCFYKHALPDGTPVDVGLPKRARKLHSENEIVNLLDLYLWDYVERRDLQWLDILASDLSDASDYSDDEGVYN